jgi:dolichol-phosphate mannosyltransferase
MRTTEKVLVIVPTYNERDNVAPLVSSIHRELPAAHVLIIDDGSPDGTGALADQLAARDRRVHVIHRPGKLGLGTAYLTGFRFALLGGYEYVFEMDCDFSHDPKYLPELLRKARDGADLVIGSRYVEDGGSVNFSLPRRIISRGGSFYARSVLGVRIRDLTGGFKCFRRRVLAGIPLDDINGVGFGFQIEMTYRALQAGFVVVETPIVFAERRAGKSKMSLRIFFEALIMVWRLRRSVAHALLPATACDKTSSTSSS